MDEGCGKKGTVVSFIACFCAWDLAEWLEGLTILVSIPASSYTVESEGVADEAVLNKVEYTVHKY